MKNTSRSFALAAALIMLLSAAACGKSDDDDSAVPKKTLGTTASKENNDPASASDGSTKTYTGDDFTFEVETSVWEEKSAGTLLFNFGYVGYNGTVNFNVSKTEAGAEYSDAVADRLINEAKSTIEALNYDKCETQKTTYNGYPCVVFRMHAPASVYGADLTQESYYLFNGTHAIVFTFTAADNEFKEKSDDFYEVLDTVSFN
ncbi:MAG: hypothetical protein IKO44_00840 [Ruminococcus sp.]|nr:hypothetical protein [Ruminococcus sp.]